MADNKIKVLLNLGASVFVDMDEFSKNSRESIIKALEDGDALIEGQTEISDIVVKDLEKDYKISLGSTDRVFEFGGRRVQYSDKTSIGKLSSAAINSMLYMLLTRKEIILDDENLSEEVSYFIEKFNELYMEDASSAEVLFVKRMLKDEFLTDNPYYSEPDFLTSICELMEELGIKEDNCLNNLIKVMYSKCNSK